MKRAFVLMIVGLLFTRPAVVGQQFRISDYDGQTITIEYPPSFDGAYLFLEQNTNLVDGSAWGAFDYLQVSLVEGATVLYSPPASSPGTASTNQSEVPYIITPEYIQAVTSGEITNEQWTASADSTALPPQDEETWFGRITAYSWVDSDGDGVDNVSEYGMGTDPYTNDAPVLSLPDDDGDPKPVHGSVTSTPGAWNTPALNQYRANIGLHGAINARILAMDGTNGMFKAENTAAELGAWIEAQCGTWTAPVSGQIYPTVNGGKFFRTETNGFTWVGKEDIYALSLHPYNNGSEQFINHLTKSDVGDPAGLATLNGTGVVVNATDPWTEEKIEACLPHLKTVSCRLQKVSGGVFDASDTTAMAQAQEQEGFGSLTPVDEIKNAICYILLSWVFDAFQGGWTLPLNGIHDYSRNQQYTFLDNLKNHGFGTTTHCGYVGLSAPYDWTDQGGFWDKYRLQNSLPSGLLTNAISKTFTRTDGSNAWLFAEDVNYGTQRTSPYGDLPPYNPPNNANIISGFLTYAGEVLSTISPPPMAESQTLIGDLNRDGQITESNDWHRVDEAHPFRFWVNEDGNQATYPEANLEDFFPVQFAAPPAGGSNLTFKLSANLYLSYIPTSMTASNCQQYLRNIDLAQALANQIPILEEGAQTTEEFEEGDIILLSALEVRTNAQIYVHILENGSEIAVSTNWFSFTSVTNMYRTKNLRSSNGDSTGEPNNWPDELTNGKDFLFVHGYNVDETAGIEWNKTIYKRLWHAGSNAKYHAILWDGTPLQTTWFDLGPYHYHNAVIHAFATAPSLASYLNGLNEPVVMAHSLGNMLVSETITGDHGLPAYKIPQYYAMNAAVALESYGDVLPSASMTSDNLFDRMDEGLFSDLIPIIPDFYEYEWRDYPFLAWSSEWYQRFTNDVNDARGKLTWRHRFSDIQEKTDAFNFYSSTEDVLRIDDGFTSFISARNSTYAWQIQEHFKGRLNSNLITGVYDGIGGAASEYCGWGFVDKEPTEHIRSIGVFELAPRRARTLHELLDENNLNLQQELDKLKTDPLFRHQPSALFGLGGATFAGSTVATSSFTFDYDIHNATYPINNVPVRDYLLAKGFPSRTRPMGSTSIGDIGGGWDIGTNFDMSDSDLNETLMTDPLRWYFQEDPYNGQYVWQHSDIKNAPYVHVYKLYERITGKEN